MTDQTQHQRDTARKVEVGTSAVAGTVGAGLGASKLRDAYAEEHPAQFRAAERATATRFGRRTARFVAHGKPGFKPLVAGAATALVATGASKYRQKKDHQLALRARPVSVSKSDTETRVPKRAYVKGIGQVRVMHYHGNGHFMCLDGSDSRRLVHRSQLQFRKATKLANVAKASTDDRERKVLRRLNAPDPAARSLKSQVLPNKSEMAVKLVNATDRLKDKVQADLQKSYDPQRSRRRRDRAVELGAAAGSGALTVRAVRVKNRAQWMHERSQTNERDAGQAMVRARKKGAEVAEDLGSMAQVRGKPRTMQNIGHTFEQHQHSFNEMGHGVTRYTQAYHETQAAHALMRGARRSAVGAVGAAAVAVGAHRAARRNSR